MAAHPETRNEWEDEAATTDPVVEIYAKIAEVAGQIGERAMELAAIDRQHLPKTLWQQMMEDWQAEQARLEAIEPSVLDKLSRRQAEVAELIGRGLTNDQIAEQLHISRSTVKNHVSQIYQITGLNRLEVSLLVEPTMSEEEALHLEVSMRFFSDTDLRVMEEMIRAYTIDEIAERLSLSPKTVRPSMHKIYKFLRVNDRINAARVVRAAQRTDAAPDTGANIGKM